MTEHHCGRTAVVEHHCGSISMAENHCRRTLVVEHHCGVIPWQSTTHRVLKGISSLGEF